MINKTMYLRLFSAPNVEIQTATESKDFRLAVKKLKKLLLQIPIKLEMAVLSEEFRDKYRVLKEVSGSEVQAKINLFRVQSNQIFEQVSIRNFLSVETVDELKLLILSLYAEAIEKRTIPEDIAGEFEQNINTLIAGLQSGAQQSNLDFKY